MSYCRTCSHKVKPDSSFCTKCGVKPNNGKQYCQSCGEKTLEQAVVCIKCGVKLASLSTFSDISFDLGSSKGGGTNLNPMNGLEALLWYFCCFPIAYMQWGQTAKGWVLLIILTFTAGAGGIVILIDYIMCFVVQQKRQLGEWEFFPQN